MISKLELKLGLEREYKIKYKILFIMIQNEIV